MKQETTIARINAIESRRERIAANTPAKTKTDLGQFFTAWPIASFMASLFAPLKDRQIRLLDPGAGVGSLSAAFGARALADGAASVDLEAWELDPAMKEPLQATLAELADYGPLRGRLQSLDFVLEGAAEVAAGQPPRFTHAILNPPYKKLRTVSEHRKALRQAGVETSNLYSAFAALSIRMLEDGGELVAITPRSFCNGTYFKPFRRLLLDQCAVTRFHVFESRTHAFKGDEVLQENVIFHLKKGAAQRSIVVSTSTDATFSDLREREVPFAEFVQPDDSEAIFHLVADEADDAVHADRAARFTNSLADIDLGVSTGPVVDFRLKEHMTDDGTEANAVPLVFAWHAENGFCSHPKIGAKKPNFIRQNEETTKWLMPSGWYVLVRRMSFKEDKRRLVPVVFDPARVPGADGLIGFENHLNVFHAGKKGLPPLVAKGLAVWLASTAADDWLRRFSGHTQVNAGDLRALRYPALETLTDWGKQVGDTLPSQEEIDRIVEG